MWHRLLILLRIRNEHDWAEPCLGPEVKHPYVAHTTLRCCEYCGGGVRNPIHAEPFDKRRTAEIFQARLNATAERNRALYGAYLAAHPAADPTIARQEIEGR